MASYINIPFINPFKFVPWNDDMLFYPNHFDLRWSKDQINTWERHIQYQQKWIRSMTTHVQIESVIPPDDLQVRDAGGAVVKTIVWAPIYDAIIYKVYQLTFDIHDLPEGVYFITQHVGFMSFDYSFVTEPIHSRDFWPNLLTFKYQHSFNDYDVIWTLGTVMQFSCEGSMPAIEFTPKRNSTSYANQDNQVTVLSAVPYRLFNLYIGGTNTDVGVAPWVLDLANRILDCDNVSVNRKRIAANVGAEWKKTAIKGYPLIAADIEVTESDNLQSLQFSNTQPLAPGIVVGYQIETDVFGAGNIVPIEDVQENQ